MATAEPSTSSYTWNDLTRLTAPFWQSQPPIQGSTWTATNVQFSGPTIQAQAGQNGAFSAAMLQEYQQLVNDTRNRIGEQLQYHYINFNNPQYLGKMHASKPLVHEAWQMDVDGL